MLAIPWNWISWKWPETCWWWTGIDFCWTFETNNSCNQIKIHWKNTLTNANLTKWFKQRRKTHLLGCKYVVTDLASCIHEFVHHMLNHRHNDVVMVHRARISNKLWNILDYLDRYRKRIHILVLKLALL